MTLLSGFQNTTLRDFRDLNLLLYMLISCGHSFFTSLTRKPLPWVGFSSWAMALQIMTPVLTLPRRVQTTSRDIDLKLKEKLERTS